MTRLQKISCVILSLCFFAVLAVKPGLFFMGGNVYRQLPLYCFLEQKARKVPLREDPETYKILQENNGEYLARLIEEENLQKNGSSRPRLYPGKLYRPRRLRRLPRKLKARRLRRFQSQPRSRRLRRFQRQRRSRRLPRRLRQLRPPLLLLRKRNWRLHWRRSSPGLLLISRRSALEIMIIF